MPEIQSVNVRALAEFSLQTGDLLPMKMQVDRMIEGARGHRRIQQSLGPGWTSEEAVSRDETVNGIPLRVQGRADAVRREGGLLRVLEIKTTTVSPNLIRLEDYPAHLAQAEIYAYLICANEGIPEAEATVLYDRMNGETRAFHKNYTLPELRERFLSCAEPYAEWIRLLGDWKEKSEPTLNDMRFPFPEPREGQRDMAKTIYLAMKHSSNALIEAPTGIGKTAASLYGALKALGKGFITNLFYLTARTTGRRAAEQALDILRAQGVMIRSVAITAKEKCCPMEKVECFGCPNAAGYYERRTHALREGMTIQALDAEKIAALAQKYEICPHELSLDLSEQADVIICDYNYAFDPRVRLRRFFDHKSNAGLLVDEAHNLPDRAREMLSASLSGNQIEDVRRLVGKYEGRQSPMFQLLTELLRLFTRPEAEPEILTELPADTIDGIARISDILDQMELIEPETRALAIDLSWFVRVAKRFDETSDRFVILSEDRRVLMRIWRFDPSAHLKKVFKSVGGAAMFSATLAPMEHYARQLGLDPREDAMLRLHSPFPRENLLVARLPVSVRFADRERTLGVVTEVIHALAAARPGNYLACFPSFQYLNQAFERYRLLHPDDFVIRQSPDMGEEARSAFIECFQPSPEASMVAFVVMGGVFAEGVDLPDDRLSGAAIVSTGIPQIGIEREWMRELFDDGFGGGYDVAYTFPGLCRVLQAAGRVIRTETDRGAVLLMDVRYGQENLLSLLPEHWKVEKIKKMEALNARLNAFWKE